MTGGSDNHREHWVERLPLASSRPWARLGLTILIVAFAFALRLLLAPLASGDMAFITFFPAVLLICFLLGVRMAALAAVASIVLAWTFFASDPLRPGMVMQRVPASVPFAILIALNLVLFHWMQRANAKLRAERARSATLAGTREILFRELQHRVSNNLQVAAGLLALQKRQVEDPAARGALDAAAHRIGVIGRVSRQLYEPHGGKRSMRAFLEPLCADIVETSGRAGVTFEVKADGALELAEEAAIPLALIVAEAVANAIEHGFAGRDKGAIEVMLRRGDEGSMLIEVHDDGCGPPEGFDASTSPSLGLAIVRMFAEQLGGSFELVRAGRTTARLTLPA
jgi:two-component sensor histidine kinase